MTKQLLLNRGFENEFDCYITQGSVSTNNDFAYSGEKSAQLIATPTEIAEISQVAFFNPPLSSFKFTFCAKRFISLDVENVSNIRAEVNFISPMGTVIPPGIVIAIRGRDISKKTWNYYEGYAEAPLSSIAAQVIIRLEPPASGSSGILIDDLALVAEVAVPVPPVQQGISAFPGSPFAPSPAPVPPAENPAVPGSPFTNPTFPGFPFTPPPVQAPPAQQQNPAFPGPPFANLPFPGFPFTLPPVQAPPAQQQNPAFPDSPLANMLFPGSPFENMMPEAPGEPKQDDQYRCSSKCSDTPDPGQNEK